MSALASAIRPTRTLSRVTSGGWIVDRVVAHPARVLAAHATRNHHRAENADASGLDIEAEMHHVAVADDVFATFEPHLTGFLSALLALVLDVVGIGDDLRANEALLEIGVNYARGLRRGAALANGPRAHFLRAGGKKRLESQQPVARVNKAVESRLGDTHVLQKHLLIRRIEICDLRLQ